VRARVRDATRDVCWSYSYHVGKEDSEDNEQDRGRPICRDSVITEGVSTSSEWKNLTAQWYREKFDPFVVYARSRPFFIAWRYAEFPLEVGFVWTTDDIRPTNSGPRDLMSVSMSVDGYSDE